MIYNVSNGAAEAIEDADYSRTPGCVACMLHFTTLRLKFQGLLDGNKAAHFDFELL